MAIDLAVVPDINNAHVTGKKSLSDTPGRKDTEIWESGDLPGYVHLCSPVYEREKKEREREIKGADTRAPVSGNQSPVTCSLIMSWDLRERRLLGLETTAAEV
ncbi:hypothetical protein C0Q70_05717 [Pomacea canaliculata]|uniref:Uncharacterized protein n=1 Tax=Pomacea canaliculata TaxID=400727 RepID=A0A2T7PM15_POMCA|nr:hypothetical protein C0Q70_05717 [Pomacea canaliculata]